MVPGDSVDEHNLLFRPHAALDSEHRELLAGITLWLCIGPRGGAGRNSPGCFLVSAIAIALRTSQTYQYKTALLLTRSAAEALDS